MRQAMNQNGFQRAYLAILGVAAAVAALGAAFATVLAGSSHAQTGAPNNTAPPTITGSATNGSRLTANRGTLDRYDADHVHVPVAALQPAGSGLCGHHRRQRARPTRSPTTTSAGRFACV